MSLFENFIKTNNENDSSNKSDEKHDGEKFKSDYSDYRNFKYLDELIKSGKNKIVLDFDIVLDDFEDKVFSSGISIDDDLIIDGNGHVIDAKGKTNIFVIRGNVTLENITFKNAFADVKGGAIISKPSVNVLIKDCNFFNNEAVMDGGAITNMGEMKITNCLFEENHTKKGGGGAISSDQGSLKASHLTIVNNKSYLGGAITNFAKFSLSDSQIKGNVAEFEGGAIYNNPGGVLRISKTEFCENSANNGIIFNRGSDVRFIGCEFFKNEIGNDFIFNEDEIILIDCNFYQNDASSIINNSKKANDLSILNGEFKDNHSKISAIHNIGKTANISKTVFKNNTCESQSSSDILNESELNVHSPNFEANSPTVLNKGKIKARKFSEEKAEKFIVNHGKIEYYYIPDNPDSRYNFSYLDKVIHDSSIVDLNKGDIKNVKLRIDENGELVLSDGNKSNIVSLTCDITLDNYEVDFYEGGIELDVDNLVIDGNNHLIDANENSRIFYVTAKNVTLKNIIFKNGRLVNKFDEHSTGGGAIRSINGSSLTLENCIFIDNHSDDDGGAIFNNGQIRSKNSKYENNSSEYYGGAVYNKKEFTSNNDSYINNRSDMAGAIYNSKLLNINGITVLKNSSKVSQHIYNSDLVKIKNVSYNINDLIFNMGNLG